MHSTTVSFLLLLFSWTLLYIVTELSHYWIISLHEGNVATTTIATHQSIPPIHGHCNTTLCMQAYKQTHKSQPFRNDLDLQLPTIMWVTSKAAESLLTGCLPHIKGGRGGALHHSSMTQYYIPTYLHVLSSQLELQSFAKPSNFCIIYRNHHYWGHDRTKFISKI